MSPCVEDMSDPQVEACAGGETLRSESINMNSTITTKIRAKGITRLRDALQRKVGLDTFCGATASTT
jgi:hypothetical protein